jgi:hypothetical protein
VVHLCSSSFFVLVKESDIKRENKYPLQLKDAIILNDLVKAHNFLHDP